MRAWLNSNWLDLLISALVAVIDVAIVAPWILLLLVASGQESMSPLVPIGAGVIGVVSFWIGRHLLEQTWDLAAMRGVSLGAWAVMVVVWFGLVTDAGFAAPLQLIDRLFSFETATLGLLLLGLVAWWRGLSLASSEDLFEADFVRGAVVRTVIAHASVLVVAGFFWEEAASPIQSLAVYMVPLGFAASLVAATAIQVRTARLNIRAEADQRLPGRGWLLAGTGIAGSILLLAGLAASTAGREAWQIAMWPILQVLRAANWLLDWVILGIALIGYALLFPIFWLISQVTGDVEVEDETEGAAEAPLFDEDDLAGESDLIPEPVLQVLQWVVIAVIIGLAIWLAMRQLQRLQRNLQNEGEAEVRESLFSSEALMSDLKAMLSGLRQGWMSRQSRFNLRREPETVRDAYQHVIVHAGRQGIPRDERESPRQYSSRLSEAEPDVHDPIDDLTERYLRARYGDLTSEEDVKIAREDWELIRQRLREQQGSD